MPAALPSVLRALDLQPKFLWPSASIQDAEAAVVAVVAVAAAAVAVDVVTVVVAAVVAEY